ncbi:hypothetical protein ACFLZ1_05190, partial [Patescibacteria group bacterium]
FLSLPAYFLLFNQSLINTINSFSQNISISIYVSPYIEIFAFLLCLIYWYFLSCLINFVIEKVKKRNKK